MDRPEPPLIEVTYGEVRLTAADPPRRSRWAAIAEGFARARTIGTWAWTFGIRALAILPVAVLLVVVLKELQYTPTILEPIGLPESVEARWVSGDVVSHRLMDAMNAIDDEALTSEYRIRFTPASRQLEIVEPGTGISLRSLTRLIRRLLDLDEVRVAGEIICSDADCAPADLSLRLRVIRPSGSAAVHVEPIGDRDADAYFHEAAIALLRELEPFVVASYYYHLHDREMAHREAMALQSPLTWATPWASYLLGKIEDDDGDHGSAIEWYRRAIRQSDFILGSQPGSLHQPHFLLPYLKIGDSLEYLGRYEEAVEAYREAIRLDPEIAVPHSDLGNSLSHLGRYEEAVEAYREAIRLDPEDAFAHYGLAMSLSDLDRHEEAVEAYREAIRLDPEDAFAHYGLALSLSYLGRHEEAVEAYREAIRLNPEDAFAFAQVSLGNGLSDLGRYEEAAEAYREAIRLDPDAEFPRENWGITLAEMMKALLPEDTCAKWSMVEDYEAVVPRDEWTPWSRETLEAVETRC